jgi:hypothetical protein
MSTNDSIQQEKELSACQYVDIILQFKGSERVRQEEKVFVSLLAIKSVPKYLLEIDWAV